ncbi:MAG: heavy-metal-associated domain-containing protein, partial [Candidatus Methanomethyliaceae archaeon]|nr:heavy-metal-associated domain-containing protein [Candidatus Methanomethyliaceae archaeon]
MEEQKIILEIDNMECASCAVALERGLSRMRGVIRASVSFASRRAIILFNPNEISKNEIKRAIERAGYRARYVEESILDEEEE